MMMINRQINGKDVLPKKDGTRVLVYPACGSDAVWVNFLNPDVFIGIDLDKSDNNPFYIRGLKTKSILYSGRDAIAPPEIPKADETVLLLKCFDWIRLPDCCWKRIGHHDSWSDLNQELWERYQKENLTSLKDYLEKCEIASKRVFVIDFDGYESIISSKGYRKLLSLTPTIDCCGDRCEFRDSKQCEKAMPLFDWSEVEKNMPGYACRTAERTKIVADVDYYFSYPTVPILATYLKENSQI